MIALILVRELISLLHLILPISKPRTKHFDIFYGIFLLSEAITNFCAFRTAAIIIIVFGFLKENFVEKHPTLVREIHIVDNIATIIVISVYIFYSKIIDLLLLCNDYLFQVNIAT
jgi:hypothetical protein